MNWLIVFAIFVLLPHWTPAFAQNPLQYVKTLSLPKLEEQRFLKWVLRGESERMLDYMNCQFEETEQTGVLYESQTQKDVIPAESPELFYHSYSETVIPPKPAGYSNSELQHVAISKAWDVFRAEIELEFKTKAENGELLSEVHYHPECLEIWSMNVNDLKRFIASLGYNTNKIQFVPFEGGITFRYESKMGKPSRQYHARAIRASCSLDNVPPVPFVISWSGQGLEMNTVSTQSIEKPGALSPLAEHEFFAPTWKALEEIYDDKKVRIELTQAQLISGCSIELVVHFLKAEAELPLIKQQWKSGVSSHIAVQTGIQVRGWNQNETRAIKQDFELDRLVQRNIALGEAAISPLDVFQRKAAWVRAWAEKHPGICTSPKLPE